LSKLWKSLCLSKFNTFKKIARLNSPIKQGLPSITKKQKNNNKKNQAQENRHKKNWDKRTRAKNRETKNIETRK
jgi:hypothetical protein